MRKLSKLEANPPEILEKIIISLISLSFLGPPTDILILLLSSKTLWKKLSPKHNPHLYAQIFLIKFDVRAAVRRLGKYCGHTTELAEELIRRCNGLRRIKANAYPRFVDNLCQEDRFLRVDLWMAYVMLLESDGKNVDQLIHYARVDRLVSTFISPGGRFHDGLEFNGGWTVDNEVNALTAWLFWLTDKGRVETETPTERQNILQVFAHVFTGSFKYQSEHAPITSFLITPLTPPPLHPPASVFSLAGSPMSSRCTIPQHFGFEITLACPLLAPAALLCCVVRLEAASAEISLPLPSHIPAARADTITMWVGGPMREDYDNSQKVTTKLVEWVEDGTTGSERFEPDWMRLRTCYTPGHHLPTRDRVCKPGSLDGLWEGRWFGIQQHDFLSILSPRDTGEPDSPIVFQFPMQLRLREHHQHEPSDIVDFNDISRDGRGAGVFNAWLPKGTTTSQSEGDLRVYVPNRRGPLTYRSYNPSAAAQVALDEELPRAHEHTGPYGDGIWDIILTAETDESFSRAWGYKRYYGRVRDWDGLVVLVREAMDGDGQWIFRGYIHGRQNLVGRWRETGTPVHMPGWEGVWSMTKKEG